MNFYKIDNDFSINLDRVVSITIIDLPVEKDSDKVKWHLVFELDIIDSVKHFTMSPDEDAYETSAYKNDEYEYRSCISKGFATIKEAELELERVSKIGKIKQEKTK